MNNINPDSIRLSQINQLYNSTKCEDSTKKLQYLKEYFQVAKKTNKLAYISIAYTLWSKYYSNCCNNNLKAISWLLEREKYMLSANDFGQIADARNALASTYEGIGDHYIAINYYNLCIKAEQNPVKKIMCYANMGGIYFKISDYTMAARSYEQAANIQNIYLSSRKIDSLNDTLTLMVLLQGLADADIAMLETDKAIGNYSKISNLNKNVNAPRYKMMFETISDLGLGKCYQLKKDYHKAIKYYNAALALVEKTNDRERKTIIMNDLGNLFFACNEIDSAMNYAREAFKTDNDNYMPDTYNLLGHIYSEKKKYSTAIQYFKKAISLFKKSGRLEGESSTWRLLSNVYEKTGNNAEALKTYKQYISLRDSVYSQDKAREMTRIEMEGEFSRKNYSDSLVQAQKDISHAKDLAIKESENRRQKAFTYGGFTGLALVILLAFFIFRNYSQQKKANVVIQAEKENAEQQRQRAERSEAFKQQFLANMSHEIRTPMNAVMGMTSLALDTGVPEKQKMYLEGIKKSSDNLLHIINDILDLSKIEAGKMELEEIDFSLSATLDQVKQVLSYRAEEKGLQLITYIDPTVPDVAVGDPVRLGQALLNLAGNGIKFTEQGSVSIEVKKVTEGVRFSVTDTGIGIPKDKLELVFEKFSQANSSDTRKFGGTGLGLSISQQLVELMGGHIHIDSEEGSGTTFSFILSLPHGSAERLKRRLAAEEDVDGSALNGLSILVVDDNEYNRIVARDTLEAKASVTIDAVASAKEGLALLQQKHYDVVLMDVQMPVLNGFDATRHIREQMEGPVKDIPVIALTASVLRTDLDKCKAAGMNSYVSKPFKASQLVVAIAEVLGLSGGAKKPVPAIVKEVVAGAITDLTYLTNYCEGDKERIEGYINMYLKAAAGFEEKAKAAMDSGEAEDAATLVHAFKPKWTMMGMAQSIELGQQIEFMTKEAGNEALIKAGLEELIVYNSKSVEELGGMA